METGSLLPASFWAYNVMVQSRFGTSISMTFACFTARFSFGSIFSASTIATTFVDFSKPSAINWYLTFTTFVWKSDWSTGKSIFITGAFFWDVLITSEFFCCLPSNSISKVGGAEFSMTVSFIMDSSILSARSFQRLLSERSCSTKIPCS